MARWFWVSVLVFVAGTNLASLHAVTLKGRVLVSNPVRTGKQAVDLQVVIWLTPLSRPADQSGRITTPDSRPRFRLVQKNKRFDPHMLLVPVGSAVEFPNLDPFFHNVFSLFEGKRFDLGLYESGSSRVTVFDRPGICYIFCNIHPEMSAVIVVLATPYFGVTDRKGEITIPDVPPGSYQLHVWYERSAPEVLNGLTREITVTENTAILETIHLTESGEMSPSHRNKYGRDYDKPSPSLPGYDPDQ